MADEVPNVPDLTPEELEQIYEEVLKQPVKYGDTAKAVASLQARVNRLTAEKAKLLDRLDEVTDEAFSKQLAEDLVEMNRNLSEATHRLASYQQQHEGRN
ncbi:MAG: hypothetical protein ACTHLW_14345 [Verrucomicrobiota bacterium]